MKPRFRTVSFLRLHWMFCFLKNNKKIRSRETGVKNCIFLCRVLHINHVTKNDLFSHKVPTLLQNLKIRCRIKIIKYRMQIFSKFSFVRLTLQPIRNWFKQSRGAFGPLIELTYTKKKQTALHDSFSTYFPICKTSTERPGFFTRDKLTRLGERIHYKMKKSGKLPCKINVRQMQRPLCNVQSKCTSIAVSGLFAMRTQQ